MKGRKKQKKHTSQDGLKLIKPETREAVLRKNRIDEYADINFPLFSFRHLKDTSIDKCRDSKFFHDFLIRLQKLSELGWEKIRLSSRHSFGMEHINKEEIKPGLPDFITADVKTLDVFRSNGDNRVMVGLQDRKIFHVFFIEAKFNDIYIH